MTPKFIDRLLGLPPVYGSGSHLTQVGMDRLIHVTYANEPTVQGDIAFYKGLVPLIDCFNVALIQCTFPTQRLLKRVVREGARLAFLDLQDRLRMGPNINIAPSNYLALLFAEIHPSVNPSVDSSNGKFWMQGTL